jgi:Ser/Thr protein kinase RdoA (MazF antagonist)
MVKHDINGSGADLRTGWQDPESGRTRTHPFDALGPDVIVDAVELAGFPCDGRVLALGSYENRVYQVGTEEGEPVVAKFYRPGRWSDAAILEEHAFALELAAAEIPVVAPLVVEEGRSDSEMARDAGTGQSPAGPVPVESQTLLRHAGFRYAVYPRRGGQWPELATEDDRKWMGRFLGRIHMVGGRRRFEHRPTLSVEAMGRQNVDYLLESGLIPDYVAHRYERVAGELVELVESAFTEVGQVRFLRIHGDCHRNNVLWTPAGPHFVDLDDCMTGPAIQDLWMLLAGDPAEIRSQLEDFLEGYTQFADFDYREVGLIEPLRALRMVHYAAWLARRWDDPAFPKAFPWFAEARYWERHVAELEEQCFAVDRGL